MLDGGKGLIEVVQQLPPLLVVLRTAKAHGVVLSAVPFHEQQVGAWALQAPRQCQAPKAGHARNDLLGLPEGGLEVILVAPSDRQQRMLESHFAMVAAVAVGPTARGAAGDVNNPVPQRDPVTAPATRMLGPWTSVWMTVSSSRSLVAGLQTWLGSLD